MKKKTEGQMCKKDNKNTADYDENSELYGMDDILSAMIGYQQCEDEVNEAENEIPDEYAGIVFCDKYGEPINPFAEDYEPDEELSNKEKKKK